MHLVVNHIIHIFVCNYALYLLSTTYLRATPYLPVNSVKVMRFSLPMPAFLVFWLPLIVWLLKFDFGITFAPKIILVLSMISIITKIVKDCTWFGIMLPVLWFVSLCLCRYLWQICILHHHGFMSPTPHFVGLRSLILIGS